MIMLIIGLWLGVWLSLVLGGGGNMRFWLLPFAAAFVILIAPVLLIMAKREKV